MTDTSLSYAMRNVPRYTSYPTAPHFSPSVTAEAYEGWLGGLSSSDSLSLYLHVPFCREICHYCGCLTKATRQDAPLVSYAKTLAQELILTAGKMRGQGPVRHIHWGGGTPGLLPRESLLELTGLIRVLFDVAPDAEHAIELDPRNVTPALAATLAECGVTRASLGVQDFDPEVQKAIGRVQPHSVVAAATEALREAGITALNFDLMYGLPGQSRDSIQDTVAKTIAFKPGRVALFGYAHVPWMRKHQRLIDEAALPGPAERIRLADIARTDLLAAGYEPIGLDHFALPADSMAIALKNGTLRRNFQGYTTDQGDQLLGFGVSSIGKLNQGYVQNISDTGAWRRAVEEGQLPVARGMALSTDDLMRGKVIEDLMTSYVCDLKATCQRFGQPVERLADSVLTLSELISEGMAELDGWTVRIPDKGRPFVRLAAAAFDAYLAPAHAEEKRHSMAV
ncbi:oxygen-independent coproporphyrinogen III oxidase [Roseibium litorale]|uniref:Coproporphyrinogen-III oxidase n=1 Tax=Roseibium litorale TaxID=2803841 RepID=A0ABR9CTL9_9HYPH|nr:oxygen-independent coproporphyrinogen III oxidase [Roseibium litorale]MBD8893934.1 oxygen-independent coproporphyrinogen III oxidase [Roseibium litorale]